MNSFGQSVQIQYILQTVFEFWEGNCIATVFIGNSAILLFLRGEFCRAKLGENQLGTRQGVPTCLRTPNTKCVMGMLLILFIIYLFIHLAQGLRKC